MNTSNKTKKFFIGIAKKAMDITGGLPFKLIYGGRGHILMFHRVVEKKQSNRLWANSYLEVTTDFLQKIIKFYLSNGFHIITLDQLEHYFKRKKKFVIFTFDDGYKDNLTLALPIFEKYQTPFIIYVTTDFPDMKARLWWYNLEDIILQQDSITLEINGKKQTFLCATYQEKEKCFGRLRHLILHDKTQQLLTQLFSEQQINATTRKLALNWDDLNLLSKNSLVTIGSHTITHNNLKNLTLPQARQEIFESKHLLETRLNIKVKHFAYPFGSYEHFGAREINLVSEAGYKTATTTINLNINRFTYKPLKLPRIAVGMTMTPDSLKLTDYGILPMRRNHFKFWV